MTRTLMLTTCLIFAGCTSSPPIPKNKDKAYAWVMAQNFIEPHLKSPSTADYGWQTSEECVTDMGDGRFVVKGWVDAQNAFGATVRSEFVVDFTIDSQGNGELNKPLKLVQR